MHDVRCYDYVEQPFARVRDALHADALGIFTRATDMASERAESLQHQLHPEIASSPVTIHVSWVEEVSWPGGRPSTTLEFECRDRDRPDAFPIVLATLTTSEMTPTETQLELFGSYVPSVADRAGDQKIAEASILAFVREVASCLREELATAAAMPTIH